ncbi:MAG: aminoacyl-tRNA hydrolase [Chloroflexota bacterium]
MSDWHMIVGLGNPGREYNNTRHNIGWAALNALARRYSITFDETQFKAIFAKATIRGKKVLLVKPQTYMNLSGQAVQPLAGFYRVDPSRLLVVYDDMDVDFGSLRLRAKGSAGGQKGMKDIINRLGTEEIDRLRLGIDRPPGRMPARAWVLRKFEGDDKIDADHMADRAADAIETWLVSGIEIAMSNHNNTTIEDPRVGVVLPPKPKPAPEPLTEE